MQNHHDTTYTTADIRENPSRVAPITASLLGAVGIAAGIAWYLSCDNFFGIIMAVLGIFCGLPCLTIGVYAILITRYAKPFGSNAYDRAFFPAVKSILAAVAVVFWLLVGVGCLAFL